MAVKRWTNKQLAEITDNEFLLQLVMDRLTNCTNAMSPLSVKLRQCQSRLFEKIDEEKADAEKPEDTNLHIDILEHDISYYLDDDSEIEVDDCEYEHIVSMIGQGYSAGELNKTDRDNPDETYRGWWSIAKG